MAEGITTTDGKVLDLEAKRAEIDQDFARAMAEPTGEDALKAFTDLSARDPYFILPAIMGGTMYVQFKMNPTSPDPMQQKIFAFMPLVMTATMMFLPAGLVVYMITNMGLSILQQWHINKVVAKESTKARN